MNAVTKRACCASFPGQAHTRVCEARRQRGSFTVLVQRCRNIVCRTLTYDATPDAGSRQRGDQRTVLPCPACGHEGEPVR
jgi:hypothetical protein